MQGSNKEWLIKSSGEIKGPYTFEEIAQGIASKEFILVDEISYQFSRWKYLREEEAFDKVIAELKNKEYSRNEKTFTNSETDTLTEDLSKQIINFAGKDELLSNVEEHLKEKEEARVTHQKTVAQQKIDEEIQIKNYALESELKKEVSKKNTFFRILVVLVIAVVLAAILILSPKKEKVLSYDDIKKIAYDNINYGNFAEAKVYLEKALAVNSTNEELKYLLSYVSVDLDDNITAQRLLGDLVKKTSDLKLKSQANNLLGVIFLKNYNLKEAKKSFEASLKQNPKYPAALFNKGVAHYLENEFDLAYQNFTQSLINGGLDGNILLAMVEMSVRKGAELKTDPKYHKQAQDVLSMIDQQSLNLYAYRQELKIAAAYMHHFLGDRNRMDELLEEAINVDPSLTNDHVHDVSFHRGLVTWDRMRNWIKKMRDTYQTNDTLRSLYGYALFKGSEKLKGKDVIEGLLRSDYSNTSNQIILSYIFMTLKQSDKAKATLAPIMHYRDKSLSFVLMGRICLEKNDYPCADLNFSEALRIDNNNISAQAGLAEVYFQQRDYKKSKALVDKVFRISPTYKPILNTKKHLEPLKIKTGMN